MPVTPHDLLSCQEDARSVQWFSAVRRLFSERLLDTGASTEQRFSVEEAKDTIGLWGGRQVSLPNMGKGKTLPGEAGKWPS